MSKVGRALRAGVLAGRALESLHARTLEGGVIFESARASCKTGWVGAWQSPSLEIFQTRLDAVLCSLLWVTLLRQEVGLDDPQRSLPTPTILCFCDSITQSLRG